MAFRADIQLTDLIKNAVVFGHKTSRWNPKMKEFIHGEKNGVHVFNADKILEKLNEALQYLHEQAKAGKKMLVIGTKPQLSRKVKEFADANGLFYINTKWVGGLLTNFTTIRSRLKNLKHLREEEASGELQKYTKKEQGKLLKEAAKMEEVLGGIKDMEKLPDIVIIFDTHRESLATKEANALHIPVVGIADSNADPDPVTYLIPANDDASRSIDFLMAAISKALSA